MKPTLIALMIVGLISGCATLLDVEKRLYGYSPNGKNGIAAKPVVEIYELPSGVGEPGLKKKLVKIVRVEPMSNARSLPTKSMEFYPWIEYAASQIQKARYRKIMAHLRDYCQTRGYSQDQSYILARNLFDNKFHIYYPLVAKGEGVSFNLVDQLKASEKHLEDLLKASAEKLGHMLNASEERRIIGTYELKRGERIVRLALLKGGVAQYHFNGEKQEEKLKWSVVDKEAYIEYANNNIEVLRINPNGTLTHIAYIDNGKRLEATEVEQSTYKKIK